MVQEYKKNDKKAHKVVVNDMYGGFSLSEKAIDFLNKQPEIVALKQNNPDFNIERYFQDQDRDNPALVRCVEALGKDASGELSNLVIENVKTDKYIIKEYDGMETIIPATSERGSYISEASSILLPSDRNNSSKDIELIDAREILYLSKLSIIKNSVKDGSKSHTQALSEINNIVLDKVPALILAAAVMQAEDLTVVPKNDIEITNPNLVPMTDSIIASAINNPSHDQILLDVSQATILHLIDCAPADKLEEIKQHLVNRQEQIEKSRAQLPQKQTQNTMPKASKVICSTMYMGARGADLVQDENGKIHRVPRNISSQTNSNQSSISLDLTSKYINKEGRF